MKEITIRKEKKEDYYDTEYMVMRAFWNIHGPGCNEHVLVRKLRESPDYLPELSRVAEIDGKIVGAIFYSRAWVKEQDKVHDILTFGPLAVEPTMENCGIGRRLLTETMELARQAGYPGIVILGEPDYYPKFGFETTEKYQITCEYGYIDALMAYKLNPSFDEVHGMLEESNAFEMADDEMEIAAITGEFPYHKPLKLSCQWLHKERLGRISAIQKNSFFIRFWEKELPAKLKGSFFHEKQELPVVGDYVTFAYNPHGESVIESVCERSSVLRRQYPADHALSHTGTGAEQVMVANVDYVFIVTSLNENYNFNRIARYVSIVLQGNSIPVVILTKVDLCNNPARFVREVEDLSDKVKVHTVSALYGIGLEELDEYVKPGVTIAMLGSSGVGKSTLVNALTGDAVMKTSGIREDDAKGRHTTTHRQMISLKDGAVLIDTPGMRELGIGEAEEGINETFSDIAELERHCKFRDCKHDTEPGCAVKAALEAGILSFEKYKLYRNLHQESDKAKKMKAIAKSRKDLKKGKR